MNAIRHPRPVAIVTGGAGLGIGHGISEALVADGWDLVIVDKDPATAATLRQRLGGGGAAMEIVVADVTEPNVPERSVVAALDRFGRLDGLVNNVGIGLVKKPGETTDEEFMGLFRVDFLAAFRFVRAALPALTEAKGAIVNIGSVHARLGARKYALYAATKSALEAFTRGLAVDYGRVGVRANIVHPGLVESPQNQALIAQLTPNPDQWLADFLTTKQCLRRAITARDVGEAVAFLLGERARSITGQSLLVDGGTTALLFDNDREET